MPETIFDKIIRREIPADIVFEDEHVLAFRDIAPKAPVHVLFIPKTPIATLNDASPAQAELLGRLMLAAAGWAKAQGFAENGYRVVMNCNGDGGQTVFHIHLHVIPRRDGDKASFIKGVLLRRDPDREATGQLLREAVAARS